MAASWPVLTLINATLAGAVAADVSAGAFIAGRVESLTLQAVFVRAAGGTTTQAWVQTSLDHGTTWMDIATFAFATTTATRVFHLTPVAVTSIATPTDGTLADNTAVNGIFGDRFRVKLTTVGTYTGASSLTISALAK